MAQSNVVYPPHKSSIGDMDANLVAVLAYVGAIVVSWIPYLQYVALAVPLVFFFLENRSKLVKFHAIQSTVLYGISTVIRIVFSIFGSIIMAIGGRTGFILAIGGLIAGTLVWLVGLVFSILGIVSIFKAYKYEHYKIPLLGDLAEKLAATLDKNYPNMTTVMTPTQTPPTQTPPPQDHTNPPTQTPPQ